MKRYPVILLLATLTIIGIVVSAETRKGGTTVFKNARVIDGTGKAVIENAAFVVGGGKIIVIGERDSIPIPKGAETVDLGGRTVMPTPIAGHSHLGLVKGTKAASANVTEENVRRQLKQYARYGIGSVVSLGADGDFIYKLRAERNAMETSGPRIFTAGLGFGVANGAPPAAAGLDQVHRPKDAEEARQQVAELSKLKPDFVKIWIDDFNGSMPVKMSREIRRTIIAEAHAHGLKVAAHVYYLSDARGLVQDGIDVLAHSIRDLPVDDELVALMKKKRTYYIATLFLDEAFFAYAEQPEWAQDSFFKDALEPGVGDLIQPDTFQPKPGAREAFQRASENLKRLHDGGVKIGLGTDSGATPLRVQGFAEHRELQLMVAAGLKPIDAIRAATLGNAELIGVASTVGSLEPGKMANFIVLEADPLAEIGNTTKIHQVWIDGVVQHP